MITLYIRERHRVLQAVIHTELHLARIVSMVETLFGFALYPDGYLNACNQVCCTILRRELNSHYLLSHCSEVVFLACTSIYKFRYKFLCHIVIDL